MTAIYFPEVNVEIAKDQTEYNTLPAHFTKDGVVITCFELDDDEIQNIIKNKKIWVQQLTFRNPLQPFSLVAVDNYFNSVVRDGTDYVVSKENEVDKRIDDLLNDDDK